MKRDKHIALDFKNEPYWWENYRPTLEDTDDIPQSADVVIVGAGYAGISCALELRRLGVDVCVLDEDAPGSGGSTRNGGCVMGGFRVGKVLDNPRDQAFVDRARNTVSAGYDFLDALITREKIHCYWEQHGRFVGAWTPQDRALQLRALERLPEAEKAGLRVISRDEQKQVIESDFYFGGLLADRSGKLDPALLFKGMLDAARRSQATICGNARVKKIAGKPGNWLIDTVRGKVKANRLVIATNGYTPKSVQQLRRKLIPIASHVIATEPLPDSLSNSLLPTGRTIAETQRILCYYRTSGDGRRLIFGGRARFTPVDPIQSAVLVRRMMVKRFPQLSNVSITHGWSGLVAKTFDGLPHMGVMGGMHYVLGCNGSGIVVMTYLGMKIARKMERREDGEDNAFDSSYFPGRPLYSGNPNFVLPFIGSYYRFRDYLDRLRAGMS